MIDSQYLMIHHYQYRQKQKEIERKNKLYKPYNPIYPIPPAQFSNLERDWFNKISHD